MVVDLGGGEGGRSDLVSESGRPGGRREDFQRLLGDGGFDVQNVGVVETERLADHEILVGVFESDPWPGQ